MKIVVLVSGGMDSTILAHFTKINYPNAEIVLLHFDYGHPFEHKELLSLPQGTIVRKFEWLDPTKPYEVPESDAGHLPGRDFAMIAQAMLQEDPDKIFLGLLHGEMTLYFDQTFEFYHRLNHILRMVSPLGKRVEVETPLEACGLDKLGAIKWALANGLTLEELSATSSCMHHEHHKCGACDVCVKRWAIFTQLGFKDVDDNSVFNSLNMVQFFYDIVQSADSGPDDLYLPALMIYFDTEDLEAISTALSYRMNDLIDEAC
ncbi:MAG: 7-cyano-7-deazaguanine synthase [Vibrio splendidus]